MIISASRRTDIPAYYSDWFFAKLASGAVDVKNPFNPNQVRTVSLKPEAVDGFVFWSKNPAPMAARLYLLSGTPFYFQYTLNAYDSDIEPGLPPLSERIETFRRISSAIGPKRVIWRYDPILTNDKYTAEWHAQAYSHIAESLAGYAQRSIISFIDSYRKITKSLRLHGISEPSGDEIRRIASLLAPSARSAGMSIATCAEEVELSEYGVTHARCVDAELMGGIAAPKKDPNQRPACGCAPSVDIGAYNTCKSGCIYCYANTIKKA